MERELAMSQNVGMNTYLVDVLESVNDEAFQGARVQYLVVVDVELIQGMDAFYLTEQNE